PTDVNTMAATISTIAAVLNPPTGCRRLARTEMAIRIPIKPIHANDAIPCNRLEIFMVPPVSMPKIIIGLHCALKHVNIFQMKTATGSIEEIFLDGSARITCLPELIPAPGQYLLAHAAASDSPLAIPL